jgi:DivIVA domain-containing protein
MHENDRRQRVISSTPHLSPEEVATRSFGTKVRGFSEAEVRGFLKRVAEQMANTRDRQEELESALDSLEEQLRVPRPLTEQELLDALGEETARLLRSAREASDDIRAKAEERATRLVEEAQDASDRMRAEAEEVLTVRTAQADAQAAELLAVAEGHAQRLRELATGEAETAIEGAREQGRHMLDDAKAARERVLVDLVRRRALLQAQIIELRGGRDRLLDAYRVVKRTFLDATEALVQVEARAATERSTAEPLDIAAESAAEIVALDAADVAPPATL